ncbi:MAG: hypothetical protein ACSLFK_04170 [Gemmatimonadaceae bacterium]
MRHLEELISEYLEWQGYFIRRNTKVGRLSHGGWEMELDVVGFHPQSQDLVHYEPSIDALSWATRTARYVKKFEAGQKYVHTELFPWLPADTPLRQIAVFVSHPKGRDTIAGGSILSIDELMAEIRAKIAIKGRMVSNAISEQYPLLRTLQMSHNGYYQPILAVSPEVDTGEPGEPASAS